MKKGFTLAEVLITLGIIGVVAALTIPTLITNYQKKQYALALKKFYTTTKQALEQFETDQGCIGDLKCTDIFNDPNKPTPYVPYGIGDWWHPSTQASQKAGDAIVKYFRVAKNCDTTSNECGNLGTYNFTTLDGMNVGIFSMGANCSGPDRSYGTVPYAGYECAYLYVDVNGLKSPNTVGRDIFKFDLFGGGARDLVPWGSSEMDERWKDSSGTIQGCKTDGSGQITNNPYYCAGRIMENNWEMDY